MIPWEVDPEQLEMLAKLADRDDLSWTDVAEQISEVGTERTAESCRNKWKRIRLEPDTKVLVDETPPAIAESLQNPEVDWDEWMSLLHKMQGMVQKVEPIYTDAHSKIDTDRPIIIQFVADMHIGSRWVCYPEFNEAFKRALDTPRLYWGMHGDEVEGFSTSFRAAFPVLDQLTKPLVQRSLANRMIAMLAEKGKLLYGCASTRAHNTGMAIGEDLLQNEYQRRNIPYFVGKGIWTLDVGSERYVFMVGHELPGTSMYNPNHSQIRALLWDCPEADFIISAHKHTYAYQEISHHELAYRAGVHPINKTHLVAVGTAKDGPDPYSISRWSQGNFVWPQFCLYPDRHEIKRVYGWDDVSHYLGE